MKKRLISALLAGMLLTGTFAGCANDQDTVRDTSTEAEAAEETEDVDAVPDEDAGVAPEIVNYEGYNFRVYNSVNNGSAIHFTFSEEITGEPVSDALYNRDRKIEDMYNITITGLEYGTAEMQKSVMANDDDCDIALIWAYDVFTSAQKNYILDFKAIPEINITNPWWDQRIGKEYSVNGKIFTMVGDYTLRSPMCEFDIQFNKKLITDYSLQNPYSMVWDGTWTFDNMWAMATTVSNDTNGDGVMDGEDRWGFITEVSAAYYFFTASGYKTLGRGESGEIIPVFEDENVYNALENSLFFGLDGNNALCVDDGKFQAKKTGGVWTEAYAMFTADQALFRSSALGDMTSYRDMETDFGILPIPKQDEAQDGYYCLVSLNDNPLVIPITVSDQSRTGNIIEALFWQSHYDVKEAFFETLLSGKLLRDEESVRMLELIIDSKTFDIDWCTNLTGIYNALNQMSAGKNNTLSSKMASLSKVSAKNIERFNKAFTEGE